MVYSLLTDSNNQREEFDVGKRDDNQFLAADNIHLAKHKYWLYIDTHLKFIILIYGHGGCSMPAEQLLIHLFTSLQSSPQITWVKTDRNPTVNKL